jgi:hypothetical protein
MELKIIGEKHIAKRKALLIFLDEAEFWMNQYEFDSHSPPISPIYILNFSKSIDFDVREKKNVLKFRSFF